MVKVAEWQQTMYGLDSGIQSGATTVRDDDGEFITSKHYTMSTTVTREEPGKTSFKGPSQPLSTVHSTSAFALITGGLFIVVISLDRLGCPVHYDQSTAGTGCHVSRDTGGTHHHPVYSDRPSPNDKRPAAG